MSPKIIQLPTGHILMVVNNVQSGFTANCRVDPLTGRILLVAGSSIRSKYILFDLEAVPGENNVIAHLREISTGKTYFAFYDITTKKWGDFYWLNTTYPLGSIPTLFTDEAVYGFPALFVGGTPTLYLSLFPNLESETTVALPALPADWTAAYSNIAKNSTGIYVHWGKKENLYPSPGEFGIAKYDLNLNFLWWKTQTEPYRPVPPLPPPLIGRFSIQSIAVDDTFIMIQHFTQSTYTIAKHTNDFPATPWLDTKTDINARYWKGNQGYYFRGTNPYSSWFPYLTHLYDTSLNSVATWADNAHCVAAGVSRFVKGVHFGSPTTNYARQFKVYEYPDTLIETIDVIDVSGTPIDS